MSQIGTSGQTSGRRFSGRQVIAVALLVALLSGVVTAQVILTSQKGVEIKEPLVIIPTSQTLSIFAGETTTANFTVTDFASVSVPATVATSLTAPSLHVTLTVLGVQSGTLFVPSTNGVVTFNPGGNLLVIQVHPDTSAVPGNYTVAVSVTR